jgi:hypothetical protein
MECTCSDIGDGGGGDGETIRDLSLEEVVEIGDFTVSEDIFFL